MAQRKILVLFLIMLSIKCLANDTDTIRGVMMYKFKRKDGVVVRVSRQAMLIKGRYFFYHKEFQEDCTDKVILEPIEKDMMYNLVRYFTFYKR